MKSKINREWPNWPTEPRALKLVEKQIEIGELTEIPMEVQPITSPRYLVTYMNSQTRSAIRSATVVSVTNQSKSSNIVTVTFYKGLTNNSSPVGSCTYIIPSDYTIDFSSRNLPIEITCCNSVCSPELDYDEGRAIVSSSNPEIAVSSRIYYTTEKDDSKLLAITDSKVVPYGAHNLGD